MPQVFLDYDQKALDDAYDQAVYAPNRDQVLLRRDRAAAAARERLGEPQRLAYGPGKNEQLDFFAAAGPGKNEQLDFFAAASPASGPDAPVVVYIHGGAWRAGRAAENSAPAEMLVDAGVHYAALDFDNAPDCDGNLLAMAEQVRRAIAWVYRNARELRADARRVHVAGGSSGAHLGGVVAITEWEKDFGLPRDTVKSFTLCSGMYDLRGPRLSKRSAYVRFTDEMEAALSPQRHLPRVHAPISLLYGSLETPEFKRQSEEFAAALRAAGKPVRLVQAEGYNHFEIQETLWNPYGIFGRALLASLGITPRAARAARGAPSPT